MSGSAGDDGTLASPPASGSAQAQAGALVEQVPKAMAGERIDRLVALIADVSRRQAVDLIESGLVLVNGQAPGKPSERLGEDDLVTVDAFDIEQGLVADAAVPVTVVYEDESVIVVDKPPHLVVHPGSGLSDGTLVHGLLARFPELTDVGQPDRPGIVHRLDKGTSGLLMVARTQHAYDDLTAQLARRTVSRVYVALVEGEVEAETGLIDAPLGRSTRQATLRAVTADGRPARTRYRVIDRYRGQDCTMVECRLETGRTHQIRVHLSAIGHPVCGDTRYGAEEGRFDLTRPFLHARHLGFRHPESNEELAFDSDPPEDLQAIIATLEPSG